VSFPPKLLDELARVFARAALDRFLRESAPQKQHPEGEQPQSECDSKLPTDSNVDNGNTAG